MTRQNQPDGAPGYLPRRLVTDNTVPTSGLSPINPDSDGNSYWDGWIGVYNVSYDRGVSYADNVVLYWENLQTDNDGDGTQGIDDPDTIVQEQTGLHHVRDMTTGEQVGPPSSTAVDIDNDGVTEHSNVHIGELHWRDVDPSQEADPTDPNPDLEPTLTVEVDYHQSVTNTGILDTLDMAEETYTLYGINTSYNIDNELDTNIAREEIRPEDASINENVQHNNPDSAYMFITSDGLDAVSPAGSHLRISIGQIIPAEWQAVMDEIWDAMYQLRI